MGLLRGRWALSLLCSLKWTCLLYLFPPFLCCVVLRPLLEGKGVGGATAVHSAW